MLDFLLTKIIGTKQERDIKRLQPIVEKVNSLEQEMVGLSDQELQARTSGFKEKLDRGAGLDDILPDAFAVVREVAKRKIGMRHFDVQIMGGVVLHQGKIAEMKTGEGKTLVATLPVYLNALQGKGVHVVTVNDYLARRDAAWMGPVYEFLGLKVGLIQHGMDYHERKAAYNADVTYGTNNEFGFDYLRDNMVTAEEQRVHRGFHYAIVDEVDSILIDEARTPLIISGPAEESTDLYYKIDRIIPWLRRDVDYQVDEKLRSASLTEEGISKAERLLKVKNLYDPSNMDYIHHINQALKAHTLFKRDVDYVVKDGKVVIVDEFTGRLMPGRRYSEGLHQALEAKEGLRIENENQTLATITFQNYFRMYEKLAGMTGTADTEAEEFDKIYGLEVVVIPTDRPMIRIDYPDVIYKTREEKNRAIIREIIEMHKKGRPVLVGTRSVEASEELSRMLKRQGIPHNVLNAKHHEREAQIVAQAGQRGAVTIATNMAGRGTDIVLGEGVAELGGLHITGTERHEARRIDNQLRGRAGRQGDPGSSRFYLALDDELMRIFGSDRISGILDRLGLEEDQPIEHPWISKAIERAQRQVESHNFDIRKHLLEYDDVMNQQREIIYGERDLILKSKNLKDHVEDMIEDEVTNLIEGLGFEEHHPDDWDISSLKRRLVQLFSTDFNIEEKIKKDTTSSALKDFLLQEIKVFYDNREKKFGQDVMRKLERFVMLHVVDSLWKDYLYNIDVLKEGINLRAYGQKNPLIEYKHEAHQMFTILISRIKEEIISSLFRVQVFDDTGEFRRRKRDVAFAPAPSPPTEGPRVPVTRKKIGRNQPCPCGSGKKYKRCCGR
jgi:preprotein translocase subunit SecA